MEQSKQDLIQELSFMYGKYEELCRAYKKLAEDSGIRTGKTVHDMSHMTFQQTDKEQK